MSANLTPTIQRCPHDRENPYAQINRDLIRDQTISPECRWLLIYLLSMKDGWIIKVTQIYEHVKKFMGKRKIYKLIDEAMAAGYIRREVNYEGNLKRGCTYFLSETPRFSNNFSDISNSGTPSFEIPKTDKHKKEQSSSKEEEKKEQYKEGPASPPSSAEAELLTDHFLSKIRERNPKFKEPNKQKWIKEFDLILRVDKRDPQEVKRIIDWAAQDKWWKAACLAPAKLRSKFDEMVIQSSSDKEKEIIRANRNYALAMKEKYPEQLKALSFDDKYAINRSAGKEVSFLMHTESFKQAFAALFGGQYVPRRD